MTKLELGVVEASHEKHVLVANVNGNTYYLITIDTLVILTALGVIWYMGLM